MRGNYFALLALPSRRAPQRVSIMEQYGLAGTQIKCAWTTCISPIFTIPITLPYTATSAECPITSWKTTYRANWGSKKSLTAQDLKAMAMRYGLNRLATAALTSFSLRICIPTTAEGPLFLLTAVGMPILGVNSAEGI